MVGHLVPLPTLGIPGSVATAVILSEAAQVAFGTGPMFNNLMALAPCGFERRPDKILLWTQC